MTSKPLASSTRQPFNWMQTTGSIHGFLIVWPWPWPWYMKLKEILRRGTGIPKIYFPGQGIWNLQPELDTQTCFLPTALILMQLVYIWAKDSEDIPKMNLGQGFQRWEHYSGTRIHIRPNTSPCCIHRWLQKLWQLLKFNKNIPEKSPLAF